MLSVNKRKFQIIILFSFLILPQFLYAQDLFFAQSYTTDGRAINAKNNWLIPAKGKSIFILFNADDLDLRGKNVFLYIDKVSGNSSKPFDTVPIKISYEKNWFVYREKFKEAGKYKIYVLDKNDNKLASGILTIRVKAPKIKDVVKQSSPYYKNVRMTFSEWVIGGIPFRELKIKYLSRKPDSVCVYLKHPDSLNTTKLYVEFYKQNQFNNNWELIDTKEYAILPMWDYVFFKYFFSEPGLYKVEVYDEKHEFIKSAYLRVKEKEKEKL